ncbi:hypothetical protein DCS_07782 [Drechmeria coniospora]|uniref:FAD-dependent oxidoreductase-like enzyme n=1 Tax=Drechmeria coniospora TaxID=98403 RepID=A0A151GFF3_DRECN|nr:hypothetical protein DCS_07782 [Drechmeria coniospora]KYK55818.1 hypothetical protein DCS_07782 [Drechmeria coniospora]
MAFHPEPQGSQSNGVEPTSSPLEPATPRKAGPPSSSSTSSSQATLPSTEVPGSPIDPNESFRTEMNEDRAATTVIPSSLTPPPSTQVASHTGHPRRAFSLSQQTVLFSPPAAIFKKMREGETATEYTTPTPQQLLDASADELRTLLQAAIAEHQRFKMEMAHHRLQYNLLSMQAEDDSKRAAVEHDMARREVDALRTAEHSRQAKRELSSASEASQVKYLQVKKWYEDSMEENETLHRRLRLAKKVIQQKEEENISLTEERDMLLTRIRENREHFHMLCSPGGIFHGALTPKQPAATTPQSSRRPAHRRTPTSGRRYENDVPEHGLSALLQAMSQDNNAAPAPSTPHRVIQRHMGRHNRNSQSMSSLPTTPVGRSHEGGASSSSVVGLVPQTEPRRRKTRPPLVPKTPTPKHERVKSRESTISAEDNEELARQALQSAAAVQAQVLGAPEVSRSRPRDGNGEDEDVFGRQASEAAAQLLRRHPNRDHETVRSIHSPRGSPRPAETSARMQARLLSDPSGTDKRKFPGGIPADEEVRREQGSPTKKLRVGGSLREDQTVGLGIRCRE